MARMFSLETVSDLVKVLDAGFVPGSTVSMSDLAVKSELELNAPVLPVDSERADLAEICRKPSKVQILTTPDLLAA